MNKEYYLSFIEGQCDDDHQNGNTTMVRTADARSGNLEMSNHCDENSRTMLDANEWWYHYCKGLIPSRIYKNTTRDEQELDEISNSREHRKQVVQLLLNYLEILRIDNGKLRFSQPNFSPYKWISFLKDYFAYRYSQQHYKPILDLDEEESHDEDHVSKILLTNDFHSFYNAHTILRGCWETVCSKHELLCVSKNSSTESNDLQTHQGSNITCYHWMAHLTQYSATPENSWNILLGVDNFFNPARTSSSMDIHYTIGTRLHDDEQIYVNKTNSSLQQTPYPISNGIGYCVQTDAPLLNGNTSYSFMDTNDEGDLFGISFYFTPPDTITLKIFGKGRNAEQSCERVEEMCVVNTQIPTDPSTPIFYPAVSLTSGQCVTLLPWNGDLDVLLRHVKALRNKNH